MKKKIIICLLLTILVISLLLCGCADNRTSNGNVEKKTVEDYKTARVGVVTGSYVSTFVRDILPDAKVLEFEATPDILLALEKGRIDIAPMDESLYVSARWDGLNLAKLEEPIETSDYGIIFKKGGNTDLRGEINDFIAEIKENGVYDELHKKWFSSSEPTEFLDPSTLNGTKGTLKIVTNEELKPFDYVKNGRQVGYDIDFIVMFAREHGYTLDIKTSPLSSLLMGVTDGTYAFGISGLTITEARKESVDFSDPYHKEAVVYIIKGDGKMGLEQFNNAKIGVVTGSLYGGYSKELFPNASISEFKNFADVLLALKQGKIEGTMLDKPNFNSVKRTDNTLSYVDVPQYSVEIGFGFQKTDSGNKLQSQMNEFLVKQGADGTIDALIEKWYGEEEPTEVIPLDELSGMELNVCIDTTRKPFVYMYENKPSGFEIEVLYKFCKEYGYGVKITDVSFASGLAGLATEKYDLVCGGLYMTPERKESVNFSEPYMVADVVMATYEKNAKGSFFASIGESFEKTFIRESRWKLIIEGVITTLIIGVCSIIGGTAVGFLLYLATRAKNKVISRIAKGFASVYSRLVTGTPTLVILMILFYVVFSSFEGISVAIIGFILTFGSFVYSQIALAVESVDKGQTEAAYALGYSRNKTFFRIVLPQAMKMFLPVYSSQIVTLIKETSVVGYIAVHDLTKVGDIISGSTYEAFFPLISIAVIYFLITWGFASLLKLLIKKTDPKKRKNKNLLKGVER